MKLIVTTFEGSYFFLIIHVGVCKNQSDDRIKMSRSKTHRQSMTGLDLL